MGVDMDNGEVTVFRRGYVMKDKVIEEFKNITVKPKSLAGKLVLGKYHLKSETPYHKPLKVGNMIIFRGKLPILYKRIK